MTDAAIPASTLVVMQEKNGRAPDLLTVTRGRAMAFASGAVAFPGGRIDRADHQLAEGFDDALAAWKIAAIRETIEETAVAGGLFPVPSTELALKLQGRLQDGADFAASLADLELQLDLSALTPFARWKPAFAHARIFDTIFFIAAAPPGDWQPRPQPGECESAEWIGAAAMLDRIEKGDAHAIFPTKRNLERLAQFGSLNEALEDAAAFPIDTITPWVADVGGEQHVCIPGDRGYPVTSEPLVTAFRA